MTGAYFKIEWDSTHAEVLFQRLIDAGRNLEPLFDEIGSELEHSTRQRISAGGPALDGTPWADLSALTKLNKRTNKPLIERGELLNSIRYEAGSDCVQFIAGPSEYAAVHQFGSDPYVILPKKGRLCLSVPVWAWPAARTRARRSAASPGAGSTTPACPPLPRPLHGRSGHYHRRRQDYLRRATER